MSSLESLSGEHVLDFGPSLTRVRLVEANDEVLAALSGSDTVRFVGAPGGRAVLCTESSTYQVTKVETSNTLLLVQRDSTTQGRLEASARADFHYELSKTTPLIDLSTVLPAFQEAGIAEDAILKSVSASPNELKAALRCKSGAVEIDGLYSWATEAQVHRSLDELINAIALREWPIEKVPLAACVSDVAAHGGDAALARHCLRHFSKSSSGQNVSLDAKTIARKLAHLVFRRSGRWEAGAFLGEWRTLLPAQAEPSVSWLDGIATKTDETSDEDGESTTYLDYAPDDSRDD